LQSRNEAVNSEITTDMLISENASIPNIDLNAIMDDHKIMKVSNKRSRCRWIKADQTRCTNNSYSACNSCTLNKQFYILCNIHFNDHKEMEAALTLQGLR
jgi:hypothetical protein